MCAAILEPNSRVEARGSPEQMKKGEDAGMVPSPPPNHRPVSLVLGGHLGSRLASTLMALDASILCCYMH